MTQTLDLVEELKAAGEDFEWYPTTRRMVDVVGQDITATVSKRPDSLLDIGAGDGRVLVMLAEHFPHAKLYGIEKSLRLMQAQPDDIIPVGTEFFEQDLMSLPVSAVFCNPPYSEFEEWACRIIDTAHAEHVYLVIPQRWELSKPIQEALKRRDATAKVIHRDNFEDAERRARAVVHIVRVRFRTREWNGYMEDPFDLWFDQNIDTFESETSVSEGLQEDVRLARLHKLDSIQGLVVAFDEDYGRMQDNYRSIFKLDYAILKELGVDKNSVREGLKKRMQGLKHIYWQALFDHLDVITSRLTTKTKRSFLERLNGQKAVAFTESNAYSVSLWAIKHANSYFDAQVVDVFRQLSTHECAKNYKSNTKTWE
jgi:hypothetical protein